MQFCDCCLLVAARVFFLFSLLHSPQPPLIFIYIYLFYRTFFLLLANSISSSSHFSLLFYSSNDHSIYYLTSGKLGTVVQITVCQSKVDTKRIVVFANTHLFFHPAAAFARLLQTDVIISTCMHVRQCIQAYGPACLKDLKINGEEVIEEEKEINDDEGKNEYDPPNSISTALKKLELGNDLHNSTPPLPLLTDTTPVRVAIMLLGDLNSTPETAVIEYFKTYVHTTTHKNMHTHVYSNTDSSQSCIIFLSSSPLQ